jgi:hypothetical protein
VDSDIDLTKDIIVASIRIDASAKEKYTEFMLVAGESALSMANEAGVLNITNKGGSMLKINAVSAETSKATIFHKGVDLENELVISNKKQWLLAYRSNYEELQTKGVISQCGPYHLLGGYNVSSTREIKQTFQLPKHDYVKIEANYHFIDFWRGETGYLSVIHHFFSKTNYRLGLAKVKKLWSGARL